MTISVYGLIKQELTAEPSAPHDIICDRVFALIPPKNYGMALRQCLSWMISSVAAGIRREVWRSVAPASAMPNPPPLSPAPQKTTASGKPVRTARNSSNFSQAWANVAAHAPDVEDMLNTQVHLGAGERKLLGDCNEGDLERAIDYYARQIAGMVATHTELIRLKKVLSNATATRLRDCTDADLRK